MNMGPKIPKTWSKEEQWVWEQIQAGEVADFNERDRETDPAFEDLDPTQAKGWDGGRRLSVSFLQDILTTKAFVDATSFKGVKILGALIDGDVTLDLAHARLERLFWLEKSRLLLDIECRDLHVAGEFSLEGSHVKGTLSLYEARIDGNLSVALGLYERNMNLSKAKISGHISMNGSTFNGAVVMSGAKVSSQLSMMGSTFNSTLTMKGTEVGQGLFMCDKATFKDVDLTAAKVGSRVDLGSSTFNGVLTMRCAKFSSQLSMNASTFNSTLTMDGIEVGLGLFMRNSIFKNVNLASAKIDEQVDMTGSAFNGKLTMNGTEVGQGLFMRDVSTNEGVYLTTFKDVDLNTAKIDGQISMIGSKVDDRVSMIVNKFDGTLKMRGIEVGQSLYMRNATFKEIDLTTAKIDGQVELSGSNFDGKLSMNAIEVGQSLFMNDGTILKNDVDLVAAKICDHLFMFGSRFECPLNLNGAKIGGDLDMHCSTFSGEVEIHSVAIGKRFIACVAEFPAKQKISFHFSSIGSNFDLSGASVGDIDLTGTTIAGEFRLGSAKGDGPTKWHKNSKLILRNTSVDAIQDAPEESNCWPRELELDGFTYRHLGGLDAEGTSDFGKRKSSWYIEWLARDPTFSPHPYEQLAKVLREAGYPTKATDVLYAGRKRARRQACKDGERLRWMGMWLMQLTIGYGLGWRYFFALGWVVAFTLLGILILIKGGQHCPSSWLIPILCQSRPVASAYNAQRGA